MALQPASAPSAAAPGPRLLRGSFAFIGGAFCFAFSTVLIKFASQPGHDLPPLMAVLARFAVGFAATAAWAFWRKADLRPRNPGLVVWRGVLNTAAVALFYSAVQFTTVTNTNLLNLSYPAWIFLTAPLVNRERSPWYYGLFLLLTLAGAFLIVVPAAHPDNWGAVFGQGPNLGDALAFGSGLVAAFGVAVLREARKHDSTVTVIFWLFAIGLALSIVPAILVWRTPVSLLEWALLIGAGACGYLGQVLITSGYRWVSAAQGSLLSSSGILISALLGAACFGDSLDWPVLLGGACIAVSLVGVSGALKRVRSA